MEKKDGLTVMVVEDFHDARLMLKESLELKGYHAAGDHEIEDRVERRVFLVYRGSVPDAQA